MEDYNLRKFKLDEWDKFNNDQNDLVGHGITAVLERGEFIEKGAVSTTITTGILTKERAISISSRQNLDFNMLIGKKYFAAALSIVLHSKSPLLPTFRSDVRYFEIENGTGWFGGGGDLTPYYINDEDIKHFHSCYKSICDQYSNNLYPVLKTWCDKYFYIPLREEHRGVGGVFFDDLSSIPKLLSFHNLSTSVEINRNQTSTDYSNNDLDEAMAFTKSICTSFMGSYIPIVKKSRSLPYNDHQRHWQLLRRGRYVEFNMLSDRGVKFGLVPGGRIEAVLVSCPPLVAWDYDYKPSENSEEEKLLQILKQPKDWV